MVARSPFRALLVAAFAALVLLVAPAVAQAALPDGNYTLQNKKSGLFVTVHEHAVTPIKIIQWPSELGVVSEGHQEWVFTRLPNGNYTIRNRKSGLFLTIHEHSVAPGHPVIQWHDEVARGSTDQQWIVEERMGTIAIRNAKSGLYLTVSNHDTKPADLIQWPNELAGNDGHQEWRISARPTGLPLPNGNYTVQNRKSGLFMTVHEHAVTPIKIIQWPSELGVVSEGHQEWVFTRLPNGNYTIRNRKSGLFLTIHEHSVAPGHPVIQWHDEVERGSTDQQWIVEGYGASFAIRNAKSGLYLTVSNHDTKPADLIQWPSELAGNDGHQEWSLVGR